MTSITQTVHVPGGPSFQAVVEASGADPVAAELARGDCPQPRNWPLFLSLLRPGAVVLDLGAHQGGFALPAAALGCRVLAVEANPANAELLRQSAGLNRFPGFELVHAAVGDRPGELHFRPIGPYGSVVVGDPGDDPGVIRVPSVTVDALLAGRGLVRVDFIKMDVEGSEAAAVRGMAGLLARPDAPVVFYESNGYTLDFFGETCQRLKAEFARFGYRNYYVDTAHARLIPVEPGDLQPDCCVDYLAVKDGPAGWLGRLLGRTPASPTMIGGWPVAAPLTRSEWTDWLRSACREDLPPAETGHVLRQCAGGPEWARTDPHVSAFVAVRRGATAGVASDR
jgi:FkbM family methyltransferase